MARVNIDELTKEYNSPGGSIVAVDDLNLSMEDGEFVVFVGPSGCGKSTTLRCVAGLETVTDGAIRFGPEDVTDQKPKERDIAMVFQNYALYPHMSARENMAFGLKMSTDLSADEISERVEETADMMGIESLLEDKPKALSGGQQQRVALGRAIVRDPEVFLMDEPLSNLDAKLRAQMRTELQQLQKELDVTTVYVTHDQTEAMTMGDRIVVLNDGQLQQVGTPLECYHRPANQFVAGFLGSPPMNFLDVEADPEDGSLRHQNFTLPLSDSAPADLDGDRFVLGIRPEHITLTETPQTHAEPDRLIETDVTVTEPMGDVTNVYLEVGGTSVTVTTDGHVGVAAGDRIHMHVPGTKTHLFDAESGAAVKHSDEPIDSKPVTETSGRAETA
ncbi:sn-glycerol-3-phosphate ABC transporter ATP-binding protein UgpC [Natrarchaeobius halalkaliphilus]|uniref:ABC-type D-xylose/L-arabinose transporter n=1 Tax=Natrarchaeobius halalkaliphilus TaxID=1679091 RepID=A0A3N6LY88_9EURY|nr:sn-glycerol-3-phosphate ABC transporter ATP-binding protein UgpC [Natrarchaeobius halalkaliphilus]RQG86672.1 sn-glycerol-3-phosphate ABC transporter ATP-binding protein UgpC [Natrarchaeobius halalkaliphilus]